MASPAALTKAISVNAEHVGSAAGLYGCGQMLVGAACTSLVALGADPGWSAALVLLGTAVLGQLAFWIGLVYQRREAGGAAGPGA
jgi:DHA1 family bicyclomycin/chloramphenicol resistance-like MFS transporter